MASNRPADFSELCFNLYFITVMSGAACLLFCLAIFLIFKIIQVGKFLKELLDGKHPKFLKRSCIIGIIIISYYLIMNYFVGEPLNTTLILTHQITTTGISMIGYLLVLIVFIIALATIFSLTVYGIYSIYNGQLSSINIKIGY